MSYGDISYKDFREMAIIMKHISSSSPGRGIAYAFLFLVNAGILVHKMTSLFQ